MFRYTTKWPYFQNLSFLENIVSVRGSNSSQNNGSSDLNETSEYTVVSKKVIETFYAQIQIKNLLNFDLNRGMYRLETVWRLLLSKADYYGLLESKLKTNIVSRIYFLLPFSFKLDLKLFHVRSLELRLPYFSFLLIAFS